MTTFLELLPECECAPADQTERGFGALSTPSGNLPLKLMDVQARVTGLLVELELRQTYVNTLGVALEATYIFPLPDRAAVHRFRLEVGDRVIEGDLQERGAARETYDRAIRAGHRAAIAEEERPGVFTMRVGNVMPGEEATVWLTLSGPLTWSAGEATFQFPLVVAPRYMPGSALGGEQVGDGVASDTDAVPDASRISPPVLLPGCRNPIALSVEVELDPAGLTLGRVRSSLHAVTIHERDGRERDGRVRVRLQPGERLNRDFILRFALEAGSSLVTSPDPALPGESTFLLTLVPPDLTTTQRPRDVVVVLDRSGSMEGWKMVAARRAAGRLLDSLGAQDRFAVLAFDDRIDTLGGEAGLLAASDRNRFRALEWLGKVDARGGTEMAAPLTRAARMLGGAEPRQRVLVLVTDGQVGNEDQILRTLAPELSGVRTFTLGIDRAVNAGFLRRLAEAGQGACELVESEDRLDEVMAHITRAIGTPVVTGLRLTPRGCEVVPGTIVPDRLPDLLIGAPVLISGRLRAVGDGAPGLEVHGADGRGHAWKEALQARGVAGRAVAGAWGRGLVRQLEDRYTISTDGAERSQLEARIVAVSLREKVLCRFTAFVAVDRAQVVNEGGRVHRVTQAVEQPEGWAQQTADCLSVMPARALRPGAAPCAAPAPMDACEELNEGMASLGYSSFDDEEVRGADPFASSMSTDPFAAGDASSFPAAPAGRLREAAPPPPPRMTAKRAKQEVTGKDAKSARPTPRASAPAPAGRSLLGKGGAGGSGAVPGAPPTGAPQQPGDPLQALLRAIDELGPVNDPAQVLELLALLPRLEQLVSALRAQGSAVAALEEAVQALARLADPADPTHWGRLGAASAEPVRARLLTALQGLTGPAPAGAAPRRSFWK